MLISEIATRVKNKESLVTVGSSHNLTEYYTDCDSCGVVKTHRYAFLGATRTKSGEWHIELKVGTIY